MGVLTGKFVERVMDAGWDVAVEELNMFEKTASQHPDSESIMRLIDTVNEMDQIDEVRGYADFAKEASETKDLMGICGQALEIDDEYGYWAGYRSAAEDESMGHSSANFLLEKIAEEEDEYDKPVDKKRFAAKAALGMGLMAAGVGATRAGFRNLHAKSHGYGYGQLRGKGLSRLQALYASQKAGKQILQSDNLKSKKDKLKRSGEKLRAFVESRSK